MPARWLLYSHDALGLGHVRRSLKIARAVLSARADVAALLVTCSPVVDALPVPSGLDYIKLPSARKLANQSYIARSLTVETDLLHSLRAALVREAARAFEPQLVLVDKSPAGLMGELRETLGMLRARSSRPRTVLGLRDILDDATGASEDWRSGDWARVVRSAYDEIWIYGDPLVFDAPRTYGWPTWFIERVRYLGYLAPAISDSARRGARHRLGASDGALAVVTVGGGEDGERLIAAYLRAVERRLLPADLKSVVVLGPCMQPAGRDALRAEAPDGVQVETFIPDLAPAIAAADVVVCMAGYNTVCEVLAGRTPAVMVPRVEPRREQWLRARCLAERELAECLEPHRLDPSTLAGAVRRALERGRTRKGLPATDGLEQLVRQVRRILPPEADTRTGPGPGEAGNGREGLAVSTAVVTESEGV